ncbi:MAG: antitoxin VapB family protein [Candidatus Woesearchaeota archaeon]|nr:antitoxin VapB family protein [Candidatus Woesearchaeota archaeon]
MPFKTITIKKSAYDLLKKHKKKNESFTELFERTFEEPTVDIMQFAGAWSDMSDEEFKEVKKRMKYIRENFGVGG